MLRSKPKLVYSGLSIVLNNPSRFDKADLISGNAGTFFSETCLRPEINKFQCDIRLKEDSSPLLDGTRAVLLLGEGAAKQWLGTDNSLNEIRGVPYERDGVIYMASYVPQDCVDLRDFESKHNPLSEHYVDEEWSDDDDDNDTSTDEKSRHGKTKRRNYGFWLWKDCIKLKRLMRTGLTAYPPPKIVIYPPEDVVIKLLTETKNKFMGFDCETDIEFNITVFSFAYDTNTIYSIPCILPDYSWAYSSLPRIYRALSVAIRDNIIVAHNGTNFDFNVLARKYRIAIGRCYDTMVAHNRCFPEQEKSLGHCISLWTNLGFHKDMGDVSYSNLTNAQQIWHYCALDVYSMMLVKESIDAYAEVTPGIKESIAQAMASIKPYLTTSLLGIKYDQIALEKRRRENDRLMTQYIRWVELLVGKETLKILRGKGKSSLLASPAQTVKYFHEMLGYPVVGKGKPRQDGSVHPSLGAVNLFKLRLKHDNPVIDIILAYRELAKESGTLAFNPYKL